MAGSLQQRGTSAIKAVAAATFAGAVALIVQGAIEQQRNNRDVIYRDLFASAQLLSFFSLITLSLYGSTRNVPNFAAFGAIIALRIIDHTYLGDNPELAAVLASATLVVASACFAL